MRLQRGLQPLGRGISWVGGRSSAMAPGQTWLHSGHVSPSAASLSISPAASPAPDLIGSGGGSVLILVRYKWGGGCSSCFQALRIPRLSSSVISSSGCGHSIKGIWDPGSPLPPRASRTQATWKWASLARRPALNCSGSQNKKEPPSWALPGVCVCLCGLGIRSQVCSPSIPAGLKHPGAKASPPHCPPAQQMQHQPSSWS